MLKLLFTRNINPIFLVLLFAFLNTDCKRKNEKSLLVIDVETGIESLSEIKCSCFIEDFEYIPLETTGNCLINKTPDIQIIGTDLVVQTYYDCFIFDARTGNYKYQVSRRGRGPGEYNNTMRLVDKTNETVLFQNKGGKILEYSLLNELIREIQLPAYNPGFDSPSLPACFANYRDWLICYFSNIDGTEKKLLMAVNKDTGNPDFIIPNPNTYENGKQSFSTGEAFFNTYSSSLFYKEIYNDTVFQLKDRKLVPHVVLFTGKKRFSHKMKFEGGYSHINYLHSLSFFESKNYFGFRYLYNTKHYFGLYSKVEDKLKITDIEKGIINDIDGFVDFKPTQYIPDNTLIGVVDAYKIAQWFSENPDEAANLPFHLQKLKTIKETDNPVVMIAKLKK